jgi:hypothetical protein
MGTMQFNRGLNRVLENQIGRWRRRVHAPVHEDALAHHGGELRGGCEEEEGETTHLCTKTPSRRERTHLCTKKPSRRERRLTCARRSPRGGRDDSPVHEDALAHHGGELRGGCEEEEGEKTHLCTKTPSRRERTHLCTKTPSRRERTHLCTKTPSHTTAASCAAGASSASSCARCEEANRAAAAGSALVPKRQFNWGFQ